MVQGVNSNFFKSKKKIKLSKLKKLLFVGRILQEKGIFNYLEAANHFNQNNYKDIIFNIVGNIDKKSFSKKNQIIFNKFLKNKNVKYLGFKKNIKNLYNQSDCIVLPTFREGLSKSLLEVTSMGKFVICSDVPGCNEIILNNYNGFLIKPNNSEDLILKIKKFLKLKPKDINKMGNFSKNRTFKFFRDELIIKRYLNLINDK